MHTSHYRKLLFGMVAGAATLFSFGAARAEVSAVPAQTLTYRSDSQETPVKEVRWGRGYYRSPNSYYGGPRGYYAPRYYSGYRGFYDAPYGRYYPGEYYRPRYGYGPRYGGYYYGGGGVRVGRVEVFWR